MPIPHVTMPGALPPQLADRLRAHALEHETAMAPGVVAADRLDRTIRNVRIVQDLLWVHGPAPARAS